jgi:uncharacterized protein (UPF0548 family)
MGQNMSCGRAQGLGPMARRRSRVGQEERLWMAARLAKRKWHKMKAIGVQTRQKEEDGLSEGGWCTCKLLILKED